MPEIIRSAQHPTIKQLKQLGTNVEARRDAGLFIVEGAKLIKEALASGCRVRRAFVRNSSQATPELRSSGVECTGVEDHVFEKVAETDNALGILLLVEIPQHLEKPVEGIRLAVAAERLQDPGNVGTLLRSAWASGVDAVYLGIGCADAYAPKTVRSAAGAQMHLFIEQQVPLALRLKQLAQAGVRIFALEPEGTKRLWEADLKPSCCWVVGSEGQGMSQEIMDLSSTTVRLEYPGKAESLNAGVSVSIALFETLRQRS